MAYLSNIDLNLFVVFDAIFTEGGVTQAARRLNLTQPAVSHALAKLRDTCGDPLFVRNGRTLSPTPAARQMISAVRQSIYGLKTTLGSLTAFDPQTARLQFTIGMRDVLESTLLPELMPAICRQAPHINIAVVRAGRRDLEAELGSGAIDAAIDVLLPVSSDVRQTRITAQSLAVLARKGHPRLRGKLTLKSYLAEEHIVVSSRRRGQSQEDLELARGGYRRSVRLRCQHYFAAARVVSTTDLLCSTTRPVADVLAKVLPLQVLTFPLATPDFDAFLYWHANVDADPANRWLRALLVAQTERPGSALRKRSGLS
jgi:DNA-binding transcriptional LysR family regulator